MITLILVVLGLFLLVMSWAGIGAGESKRRDWEDRNCRRPKKRKRK